ncbi:pyridoxal phosphate-dependent decarboxylase family protein [Lujinxingia sediminis]|nr:aspartate aminotransferase family protein [Lujinxingia sediminis]
MSESLTIPEKGLDKNMLLEQMRELRDADGNWREGRTWSLVYYADEEHYDFLKEAHNTFFSENGLNPMVFKSLRRMESEVVRMSAEMLHGDGDVVGTMTSGGTESILMAVKAARERFRKKRFIFNGQPELVVPESIHVAFGKAAHYFGLKVRYVPLRDDFRVDVDALKRAVNRNTALIAASAPQYAHGVIDPIEEIGAFAQREDIPFHVDACFGGFFLPWMEKLGYDLPPFDFRVPGVTSISADVHKYGYAAKGASVVLYRNMSYLKHQFYISTDWPGGIYPSPSAAGTRPGGPIAAAWAAMKAMGEDGYLKLTRTTMEAVEALQSGVRRIEGLKVLGSTDGPMVCVAADGPEVDIYAVVDQLNAKGWNLDRQQNPNSFHLSVTANHLQAVPAFLEDLQQAVEHVRAHPELKSEGQAAMYGMIAKIPFRGAVKFSVQKIMEGMYGPDGKVPDLGGEATEDDDLIMQLMDKYGDKAMGILEKLESSREVIKDALSWKK